MRPLVMSTLLLATLVLPAGVCRGNDPVRLTLRSAADVGPQIAVAKGPQGEPSFQWTGAVAGGEAGTNDPAALNTAFNNPLLVVDTPAFSWTNYVLRGRMKCQGVVGDAHFELMGDRPDEGCASPGWKFSGTSDWQDFELRVEHHIPASGDIPEELPEATARHLRILVMLPGAGSVTVAGPFVVARVAFSDGKFRPTGQVITLQSSAVAIGPRAAKAEGPAREPAIEVASGGSPRDFILSVVDNPAITSADYVLRGRVKCAGVVGEGYLELLNDFGDKGSFFTRSLGDLGPKLTGSSDWRDFELPFHADPGMKPRRLTLIVVLPGAGQVTVAEPLVVSDAASQANGPGTMEFRSAASVGPQATSAKGPAGEAAIEVAGGDAASTSTLLICDNPAISSPDYVVRGRVKYDGVVGDGYLELLNDFGDKGTYFSRALAGSGPMKKLTGTSDWRDFELPFHAEPGMKPRRLKLNVVLPGAGKVTVTQPLVVESRIVKRGWWTDQQAGTIGAWIGCLGGLLGSLIGVTAAWHRLRALTAALCGSGLAAGAVALAAGLVALSVGQPWHVWYPLLLAGFGGTIICGPLLAMVFRRSRADEFRRMTAADVV